MSTPQLVDFKIPREGKFSYNFDANRPMNSPFRYAGGKFYARKLIMQYIPDHSGYIEPFAGGASIFFAQPKAEFNWLNDIDPELMNCLTQIRDHAEALVSLIKDEVASKERHSFYKNEFRPKNKLERALRWYYINRTSYSGIMKMQNCYWGYGDKYSKRPENWPKTIFEASIKLQGVKLTTYDFWDVISAVPAESFLFIDPPYFNADQDKFYPFSFNHHDHFRLAEVLQANAHKLSFLLTYDNSQEVRELYKWCPTILEKEWNYTINRTDDQTKDGRNGGNDKKRARYKGKEIFIMNHIPKVPEQRSLYDISSQLSPLTFQN